VNLPDGHVTRIDDPTCHVKVAADIIDPRCLAHCNENRRPFRWTKSANEITGIRNPELIYETHTRTELNWRTFLSARFAIYEADDMGDIPSLLFERTRSNVSIRLLLFTKAPLLNPT